MRTLVVAVALLVAGSDEDAPDYRPGLACEVVAGGKTIRRIDGELSFEWGTGSPDSRVSAGPFRVRWTGRLFVNRDDSYRFSARLAGRVRLRIGDKTALEGEPGESGWLTSAPLALEYGY